MLYQISRGTRKIRGIEQFETFSFYQILYKNYKIIMKYLINQILKKNLSLTFIFFLLLLFSSTIISSKLDNAEKTLSSIPVVVKKMS